jgi:hypothetical protein
MKFAITFALAFHTALAFAQWTPSAQRIAMPVVSSEWRVRPIAVPVALPKPSAASSIAPHIVPCIMWGPSLFCSDAVVAAGNLVTLPRTAGGVIDDKRMPQ